ncbi:hypothetical protein NM688_g5849 [Phlebia brevispora]|uniref:Uncharacterized protein n=1 Tax=Phlebia brevispora TaxID=194682 RepID=A0ACC1SNU2_9APHY|nr:hypothetical protein NM688_g5849 [Phlebia brevispora]
MAPNKRLISTEIGPATLVSIRYFLDHVLPPLHSSIDLDTVLERLRRHRQGSRGPITRNGRWWGFAKDPAQVKRPKTGFSNFLGIVSAIARCSISKSTKPGLQLLQNPRPTRGSARYDAEALPDAYMVAPDADRTRVTWTDVVVIGEHEKYFHSKEENITRLTQSMSRAFENPRRRFVYGYTLDDMAMRLWFCDRSQLIASTNFNFITHHEPIVCFFLSLLYAESHYLGWDPTIRIVRNPSNTHQYDYTVENVDGSTSTFRTLKLLCGPGSRTTKGKGTRVWKVVQVVDGVPVGKPAILKDHWVQEEFEREGTTLSRIRQSDDSEDFQRAFSANFLTVLCHGDVVLRSHRHAPYCDRTRLHIRNAKAYKLDVPLPDADFFGPRPHVPYRVVSKEDPYLTGCRVHYRIVFRECCTSLDISTPLPVVFTTLAQICTALKLLHQAGWVHRDISLGNIMLDESGHARLMELEYAKPMGDETIPDLRIGTSPFMSAEVVSQMYSCSLPSPKPRNLRFEGPFAELSPRTRFYRIAAKYHLPLPSSDTGDPSTFNFERQFGLALVRKQVELYEQGKSWSPITPDTSSSEPKPLRTPSPPLAKVSGAIDFGFRYNPLHDLESVFWIATYFLFGVATKGMDTHQQHVTQRLLHEKTQRNMCIRLNGCYRNDLDALPRHLQVMGFVLDDWRSELGAVFYTAEKQWKSIDSSTGAGLHDRLARTLEKMANLANLPREDNQRSSATQSRKHRLEDPDDSDMREFTANVPARPTKKARTTERT